MKKLQDYGVRIISHGMWSDPEVEWKKSKYQKLIFNYWDCVECFEDDDYDLSNEDDIETFVENLHELTPSEYHFSEIYYEWTVWTDSGNGLYDDYLFDDADYYKKYKLSPKEDTILHTAGQALRQALSYIFDSGIRNAEISVRRRDNGSDKLVAQYILQGTNLKDLTIYTKK